MQFTFALPLLLISLSSAVAFAPGTDNRAWGQSLVIGACHGSNSRLCSSVKSEQAIAEHIVDELENSSPVEISQPASSEEGVLALTGEEINARLASQLQKLAEKDRLSKQLSKEDVKVIYEDEEIVVVNKPTGVLSVPGRVDNPSLNKAVFDAIGCEMGRMDMMVVHRLGMDTSGLIVFAKTMEALRGMNTIFRTRQIERKYEALVCGHMEKDEGIINLPLMRDYEFPPFMRISTEEHQRVLADLDPEVVGKKILEQPKESITKYEVISREELEGEPVTRVSLTSMSGRTHQLNVHLAAFGHPIAGDTIYGIGGDAASHGGLTRAELDTLVPNNARASASLQRRIAKIVEGKGSCAHAKFLKFRHPVTNEDIELSVDAPF